MKTPVGLAQKVIEAHNLDTLAAYDTGERLRLFYMEAPAEELTGHLQDLASTLDGVFLVKAWKRRRNPKGGRGTVADQPYAWHIQGRKVEQVETVTGTPAAMPQHLLDELTELRVAAAVRERLDALEEDDDDEPQAPDTVGQLFTLLTVLLHPAAAAPAPVAGTERGPASALQGERLEQIVNAVRNLHRQDPETFAQYEAALLSTYGKAG